jgi:hypothetical protein
VQKKGTTRSNVDPKVLREGRDLKILLLQKKIPPRKDGMCNWLLQAHMQIMMHGWLTQVHPFV